MNKLTINDLIEGEIYKIKKDNDPINLVFKKTLRINASPGVQTHIKQYSNVYTCSLLSGEYYTNATALEKKWLLACMDKENYTECPTNRVIISKLNLDV